MIQGLSSRAIAGELGIPDRTVAHWMMRWREIAHEEGDRELLDRDYRTAIRADELINDGMDYIAEDTSGERAFKSLIQLNAVRGTAVDKLLRRKEQPSTNIQVNVLLGDTLEAFTARLNRLTPSVHRIPPSASDITFTDTANTGFTEPSVSDPEPGDDVPG